MSGSSPTGGGRGVAHRVAASARFRLTRLLRGPLPRRLVGPVARRRRQRPEAAGRATVVIVTWNALEHLAVCVAAVARRSPPGTEVLVVDNASSDGTRRWLRRHHVRHLPLPVNVGHGAALDLGALAVRTEYLVTLDVDAFPLSDGWLDALLAPLAAGARISGVQVERPFAHPSCAALRTDDLFDRHHTFQARYRAEGLGTTAWDCGERISMLEQPAVHLIQATGSYGPGWVGTRWGDVVYHNFYAVRHLHAGADAELDDGIRAEHAADAWDRATRELLGLDADARRALWEDDGGG